MVEGAALEMLYRGNSIVGSNPTLSAIFILNFRLYFSGVAITFSQLTFPPHGRDRTKLLILRLFPERMIASAAPDRKARRFVPDSTPQPDSSRGIA